MKRSQIYPRNEREDVPMRSQQHSCLSSRHDATISHATVDGGHSQVPPIDEELQVSNNFRETDNPFFPWMIFLIDCSVPSNQPWPCAHISNVDTHVAIIIR